MKKKTVLAMLLAGCLATAPSGVSAEEADAQATEETAAEESALSDDLFDFQMEILGEVYQFPMTYADFTAKGWTLKNEEDGNEMLGANTYGFVTFRKGDLSASADMVNLMVNEAPVTDCLAAGIEIDGVYSDADIASLGIKLAKGVTMGVSTVDDIKAAYGEPSDTYEGDLYWKLTYEKDIYEEVEFYVYKEQNTLLEVSLRNMVEPENFDKGSVSGETPEIVTSYAAPAELGEDMLDPVVEYCGDLYNLPCPITAFQANGWKLDGISEDDFVEGRGIDFITMTRDAQSIDLTVHNKTQNAVLHENCFVTELELSVYDASNLSLTLSGGYELGAAKADILAAAEAKGYQAEESDKYLNIYKDDDSKIDTRIDFGFYDDEDENKVTTITFRNEVLE